MASPTKRAHSKLYGRSTADGSVAAAAAGEPHAIYAEKEVTALLRPVSEDSKYICPMMCAFADSMYCWQVLKPNGVILCLLEVHLAWLFPSGG